MVVFCYYMQMWFLKLRKKKKKAISPTYLKHKEEARSMIHNRIQYWTSICDVQYKRIAIKDTKRCWGSCSSLGNLNFNYKLIFLPQCLSDYIIVHELCHLKELNHSPKFWLEVEKIIPHYQELITELRQIEKNTRTNIKALRSYQDTHTCKHCENNSYSVVQD
jgi:predicted metal-dependent hydrolase